MPACAPLRPHPARLLLLGDERERGRLSELFAFEGVAVDYAPGAPLPDPRPFGAVVVVGPLAVEAEWLEALREAVRAGASLVAFSGPPAAAPSGWEEWLGVRAVSSLPPGEWFIKVALSDGLLTERLPAELAAVCAPLELGPCGGEVLPVLQVNAAFADRTVVTERRLGEGRIVVCGLDPDVIGRAGDLRTLLRRAVLPARSLARRDRPIGFGVLGYGPYGGMGLYHGLAAQATPGLEMIAACDSDPARRKAAEEEFPGLRPYAGVGELVADEDVEVVVVATPPVSHFDLARALLEAGKHVALEKPMCLTVAEADELIRLAGEGELLLTVHQSRRWDPDFLAVRRVVAEGMVGELFNVETFVGGFEHPCRAWHSEVSMSGGAVYDWGSHHLDWILQLMGDFPAHLVAHGHKRVWNDVTNLDQVRVRLTWSDGREAEFLQSDVAAIRRPKFFLQGTAGTIAGNYRPLHFERLEPGIGYVSQLSHHAEAPVDLLLSRYEPGYGLTETRLPPAPADRYGFHRNLADHLSFGEPIAVSAGSAREVVALLEAAQRSTDEGNVAITLVPPGP